MTITFVFARCPPPYLLIKFNYYILMDFARFESK